MRWGFCDECGCHEVPLFTNEDQRYQMCKMCWQTLNPCVEESEHEEQDDREEEEDESKATKK